MRHQRGDVAELGRFALQEFLADRNIVEQVPDVHLGARGPGAFAHVAHLPAVDFNLGPRCVLPLPRLHLQPRNGRHRRQSLAAKTERRDRHQVFRPANLAGGVALESQQRVIAPHAFPVVEHANPPAPARIHLDLYAACPGVERIFQQFLHHRRRPLDHLTGGNLV